MDHIRKYDHDKLEFLCEFAVDLNAEAELGKLSRVVGREEQIQMMIQTLCRTTKSNPVLVGPAGVGKTALVEGLAVKIVAGDVPEKLRGCRIFSVSSSTLMAGCMWYGMIEARINNLLEEAKQDKIIVFIDEIHTIMESGPGTAPQRDIAQQLKPAMSRSDIRLIGATTDEEYRRFIEQDRALERRLQPIRVPELSPDDTFLILRGIAAGYLAKGSVEIGDSILRLVLSYGERFFRNHYFPDKAIDLLEQTVAYAESQNKSYISSDDAKLTVQRMVGMPPNLSDSLRTLSEKLTQRELLDAVQSRQFSDLLRVSMQGLNINPERPNATILLLGESSGNAENMAELIAAELFEAEDRVTRINLAGIANKSEFEQMIGIEKFGSRQDPDTPIAKISQTPWCVILCEGLEDCDQTVQEVWARAVESGSLASADNKRVYLSDAIVIMAADVNVSPKNKLGFSTTVGESAGVVSGHIERLISQSLIALADLTVIDDGSKLQTIRRQWLRQNLYENLTKRLRRQAVYLQWDKTIIDLLAEKLDGLENEHEWEKLINLQVLPELMPFIEEHESGVSIIVKFEDDGIVVETAELPESVEEQLKMEETVKLELFYKIEQWVKGLFYAESEGDLSKLTIHDGTTRIDIYFSFWKDRLVLSFQAFVAELSHESEDLKGYLLERNMILRFGKLAVESDGGVWLEYSMFAENLEQGNFLTVLRTMFENVRKYGLDVRNRVRLEPDPTGLSDEAANWLESRRVINSK